LTEGGRALCFHAYGWLFSVCSTITTRTSRDLIVEANPRADIWMLLRCGALTEGAVTELKWGDHGGSRLARHGPNLLLDGNAILVVWDEPMEGVGRPGLNVIYASGAAGISIFASWACRCCWLDYNRDSQAQASVVRFRHGSRRVQQLARSRHCCASNETGG